MLLEILSESIFVSLTTFRKNGNPVATPLSKLAIYDDKLYLVTGAMTGKMKRLKHTKYVQIAPCKHDGTITGEVVEAEARILDEEVVQDLFNSGILKLNLIMRFFNFLRVLRAGGNVYLEISTTQVR